MKDINQHFEIDFVFLRTRLVVKPKTTDLEFEEHILNNYFTIRIRNRTRTKTTCVLNFVAQHVRSSRGTKLIPNTWIDDVTNGYANHDDIDKRGPNGTRKM